MRYPSARRERRFDVIHGHVVADPYRWLEDPDSSETKAWLASQDQLFVRQMKHYAPREKLLARLNELYSCGYRSAPTVRGSNTFYTQRLGSEERGKLWVREAGGSERVLVDPIALAPDGTVQLDQYHPSPDGRLLAYQLSSGGTEESDLYVMDVASGKNIEGPVDRTRYCNLAWLPDGSGFYYGRRLAPGAVPEGESLFHRRIYFHNLGSDYDQDPEVFGAGRDMREYHYVSISRDGRWLTVTASTGSAPRNDLYISDLAGDKLFRAIQEGVDASTYGEVGDDGRLILHTDRNAPRGRLVVCDPLAPQQENWVDLIPESKDAVLVSFSCTQDRLVATWSRDAVTSMSVHDLASGRHDHDISLPGAGKAVARNCRLDRTDELVVEYEDFVTLGDVYSYNVKSRKLEVLVPQPGAPAAHKIKVEQVHYTSKDGTDIPMFVIHKAGQVLDGKRPTILYGYGGFNIAMEPGRNSQAITWVEQGGVYAIANLRGGSERGEDWHRAGMRDRKQNVFDDFIAGAEWLIQNGYTDSQHLGISGGSNGGLLVGAALTQRPDLFSSVVCAVPLLDMVRYEKFSIGRTWNDEYGSADDPSEFEWLLGYSPYHHVVRGESYPAVFFASGNADARTDPAHARKMTAALQWATSSRRPIILRREDKVGHQGGKVSQHAAASADELAFMAGELGLEVGVHRRREGQKLTGREIA